MKSVAILTLGLMAASALAFAPACGDDTEEPPPDDPVKVTPAAFGEPYDDLAQWNLFEDPLAQKPAEDLVPFDVISPLFSDYALKWRFIYLPEGETIHYVADGEWEFPVGTLLVKTFAYQLPEGGRRLLETRLLWREPEGWTPHTYVWNEEQTAATREVGGMFVSIDFVDAGGQERHNDYRVPNTNECKDCHHQDDENGDAIVVSLGPKTRQLDRDFDYGSGPENQIDHFASLGFFDGDPQPAADRERLVDPAGDDDISLRARSYFDANCSGCHRVGGSATQSSLLLDFHSTDPETQDVANWGVCKVPTSAGGATCGREYDVVPGEPDQSIITCRMSSTDLDARMPPLGSKIVHDEGLALVEEWIESLPPGVCN